MYHRDRCLIPSGSSPRGRGKLQSSRPLGRYRRLIPAWAGKTGEVERGRTGTTAHPRVGGENETDAGTEIEARGSSPRGRGKQPLMQRHHERIGLIPAWAGKTQFLKKNADECRAHPRVGGENIKVAAVSVGERGSSPRGRGKPRALRRS